MQNLFLLDYAIIVFYFVLVLCIGFFFARGENSSEEYLLGGRRMPTLAIGLSCMVSLLSSVSIVMVPGEIFNNGLTLFIFQGTIGLALSIPCYLLFTRFYFLLGSFTPYEYLEYRYDGTVRAVVAISAFYTRTVPVSANKEGDGELSVTLVAADGPQKVSEYFTLRSPTGGELPFIDGSVVLSAKTAEELGVAAGDSVWVQATDGSRVEVKLTGVTQNYLGAYLYVTENTLSRLVADPAPNTVYARTSCGTDTERETLSTILLGCNYVSGTAFTADAAAMYDSTITCINYVVLLIIACAAALAAVVLYNLISVNIGERKKELATIKVLGFFDKEVYRYIFREIELLSVIGAALGLAVGVPLHQFVIRTVESEQMMFIRMLEPTSYLYSVALTLLFTVAVCRLMRRQVRGISMVESMKAPE